MKFKLAKKKSINLWFIYLWIFAILQFSIKLFKMKEK